MRAKDIFPTPVKSTPESQNSDNPKNNLEGAFEIPKFDLAEQILAQQRSLACNKRKSPEKKIETFLPQSDTCPTGQAAFRPIPSFPQQDLIIIKEIVARDIDKLCRCRITR